MTYKPIKQEYRGFIRSYGEQLDAAEKEHTYNPSPETLNKVERLRQFYQTAVSRYLNSYED